MNKDRIHYFDDIKTAGKFVQNLIKQGDIILIKGSQGVRMEKIVKEIMANPQLAGQLLVRQTPPWV
jgi:UDP-N-acetylmuramoyl-tripeptide--D-alanyl-D-alanine ligase